MSDNILKSYVSFGCNSMIKTTKSIGYIVSISDSRVTIAMYEINCLGYRGFLSAGCHFMHMMPKMYLHVSQSIECNQFSIFVFLFVVAVAFFGLLKR